VPSASFDVSLSYSIRGPGCRLIRLRPSVFDRFPCGEVDVDLCYWGDAYLPSTWFETSKWCCFYTFLYCLCAECALLLDSSVCLYLLADYQVKCNLRNVMWRLTWHFNWNTAKHWLMFQYLLCPLFCVTCRTGVYIFKKDGWNTTKVVSYIASATYFIYYWLLLIMNEVGRMMKWNVQTEFPNVLSEFYNLSGDGRSTFGIWTRKLEIHRYSILFIYFFFCKMDWLLWIMKWYLFSSRNSQ